MFVYKGYIAIEEKTSKPAVWVVRDQAGNVCIEKSGTQREVKQSIDRFLGEGAS